MGIGNNKKSRNKRNSLLVPNTVEENDVNTIFDTVKNDLQKVSYSLSKVLNSHKIRSNLKPRIKNTFTVNFKNPLYLKIPVEFCPVPLTIQIMDKNKEEYGLSKSNIGGRYSTIQFSTLNNRQQKVGFYKTPLFILKYRII